MVVVCTSLVFEAQQKSDLELAFDKPKHLSALGVDGGRLS